MNLARIPAYALQLMAISLAGLAAAQDPADSHPDLHLIPWPKSIQVGDGFLPLTVDSRVVAGDERLRPLAEIVSREIQLATGRVLQVASGAGQAGDIVLTLDVALRADEPLLAVRNRQLQRTTDGAHTIRIDQQAIVTGFDYRATAEGTATILQLLSQRGEEIRLPKVTIKDWPHADYCGVLLDVARQDHPIDAIKQVVRLCRLYKTRYLQLHLTDDQGWTFPSTRYPRLGSKNYGAHGGVAPRVYPLDELRDLVAFADARGVTLVPEFELPGHSGAALRSLPEVFDAIDPQSRQPVGMGCMNMSNEAIYPVLDTIIGEMCDVFRSSPYFHIGSDEVSSGRLALHPGYQAFMAKHQLKDDHQLADHFVAAACAIVKKHGKKAIKWEGLSNFATDDVIIMAWEVNSTLATAALARGYTTITCPWHLSVPWEQWSMYRCNGSQLKPGDSVLGATLVAWEQPPATHIANLRQLPLRQERTWGPDNHVTVDGFAARFQPLDALAGKLLDIPPRLALPATLSTSVGTHDSLEPALAFDGNDSTYYQSAIAPQPGDHFTLRLNEPRLVHAVEVLTGINRRGLASGCEVQVSADGTQFTTVATLDKGGAQVVLTQNLIRAVRIRAVTPQREPLVVRAINLRLMVELSGKVSNPTTAVGAGNVAVIQGDTQFMYPIGSCAAPVVNRGFTLRIDNGGNPCNYSGAISGSGNVELVAGGENAPLVLDGVEPNSLRGAWFVKAGRVVLAKPPGTAAMGERIVVGGSGPLDGLVWNGHDQVGDGASIELRDSPTGGAQLRLNGFSDTVDHLELTSACTVLTDGAPNSGVLSVRALTVDGRRLAKGVYTSAEPWLRGGGYVVVGDVQRIEVQGIIPDPLPTIGSGNIAVLKAATTLRLPRDDIAVSVATGSFPLTLTSRGAARFAGFVTGQGSVNIDAGSDGAGARQALVIGGAASNSYRGPTSLVRGVLKLDKPTKSVAIPGDLTLGGSADENKNDAVVWGADGQLTPSAVVTVLGDQPARLDLDGHHALLSKVVLSTAARIRTGQGGTMRVKQFWVGGQRLADGVYAAPQTWLEGSGAVTVNSRVDVQGVVGSPELAIGAGHMGNMTGNLTIAYPSSGTDVDILTNGFTLTLDSGNGNPLAYSGSVSGTGNVEFFMGPTYTDHKDAPLRLSGERPNTLTGKFLVRKGRVQLEKPVGVDAISSDVTVGGQGFNDCLFWVNSHQLKDSVQITLVDAGNSGAAYLHLNGCRETVAGLAMTARNKVKTNGPNGAHGVLTVKSLTINGVPEPAGAYTAANAPWIEGGGQVIVQPES